VIAARIYLVIALDPCRVTPRIEVVLDVPGCYASARLSQFAIKRWVAKWSPCPGTDVEVTYAR
jgi:hypothetical protein